ncbi:MAG: DUF1501 domain-containing protein [Saprospiraceae bacterium]
MTKRRNISRRKFLGQASCAAIGSTTFLSTALNLGMINTAAARPHIIGAPSDYKALVVILLAGGADSHNMLIPTTPSEYSTYSTIRSDLALSYNISGTPDDVMNITPSNTGGRTYGVHNGLAGIKSLFDQNKAAFVANVGTLIEPIANLNDLRYSNKKIPLGLYSHADQIMQWQTSVPDDRSAVGVGGRIADMLKDMNTIDAISMNISLDGKNRFQSGNTISEYSIGNSADPEDIGMQGLTSWWSNSGFLTQQRDEAIKSVVEDVYSNIFQDTYADLSRQTIAGNDLFKTAIAKRPGFSSPFAPTALSQDLRMMADIISVQQHLGANRQIFFTTFGGWDHHDEVLNNQNRMLPILDGAISSMYTSLTELGIQNDVTIMTISDFGRTMTTNTGGSDHAWGGNSIIVGGAVNGGQIFGEYPDLDLANTVNIDNRGRYIPQLSVDELYAEIALWFGVAVSDLNYILPNIGNFNNYVSNPAPLGLFNV